MTWSESTQRLAIARGSFARLLVIIRDHGMERLWIIVIFFSQIPAQFFPIALKAECSAWFLICLIYGVYLTWGFPGTWNVSPNIWVKRERALAFEILFLIGSVQLEIIIILMIIMTQKWSDLFLIWTYLTGKKKKGFQPVFGFFLFNARWVLTHWWLIRHTTCQIWKVSTPTSRSYMFE